MTRDHDSEYYQTQFAERARVYHDTQGREIEEADVEAALVRSEGSAIVEVWCSRCAEPASVTRAGVALCAFHDGYEQGMAAVLPATAGLIQEADEPGVTEQMAQYQREGR